MNSIKTLNINGKELQAVGNFLFIKKAKNTVKGEEGLDGFKAIYTGIIAQDPTSLSDFFRCAIPVGYSEDTIDKAIMERLEETQGDYMPLFRGALEIMEQELQVKGLVRQFWAEIEKGKEKTKTKEDREQMETYLQTMREAQIEILNYTAAPQTVAPQVQETAQTEAPQMM